MLPLNIYVASSWRNKHQPEVVAMLRDEGHKVYDFRNPPEATGFSWSKVHAEVTDRLCNGKWIESLSADACVEGFGVDMDGLRFSDLCVLVGPCGRSAHLELGWAAGANKKTIIYLPEDQEAELMYKMAGAICTELQQLQNMVRVADSEIRRPYGQAGDLMNRPVTPPKRLLYV